MEKKPKVKFLVKGNGSGNEELSFTEKLFRIIFKNLPRYKTRPWWSLYEHLVYNLDILVPEPDPEHIEKPEDGYVQEVRIGKKVRWRPIKDGYATLTPWLREGINRKEEVYVVLDEGGSALPFFDKHSKFLKKWDMLMIILLFFTAFVIPFETAFISETGINILFLVNIMVDILFLTDMFVQCLTPYIDATTGKEIRDHKKIIRKYFYSWFAVDLMSVIPFDVLSLVSGANLHDLSSLRLLRFLRLSRLLKLLRILRANRKIKQWQTSIGIQLSTFNIIKVLILLIAFIHWFGCGYKLAGDQTASNDAFGWTKIYAEATGNAGIWDLYLASLYWATSTLSTIGISNQLLAPKQSREFGFAVFANFCSYILLIYISSTITDVLQVTRADLRRHELKHDNYLKMFHTLHLKYNLRYRVNEYLENFESVRLVSNFTHLLQDLPAQLHSFITVSIFIPILERIPYIEPFLPFDPLLVQEMSRGVEIRGYPPHSQVFSDGYEGIYFIERGILAVEGRVYTAGDVFGLDCLRYNAKPISGRALTLVTIYLLPKESILSTLEIRPQVMDYARRWTVWSAFRRYVFVYSQLYYRFAKKGKTMEPPVQSRRPLEKEEDIDEIDELVAEQMEFGF